MSWIADAHRDWHTVNGWDKVCPMDCGVGEGGDDYYLPEPEDEDGEDPGEEGPGEEWFSASDLDYEANRAEEREYGRDPWS